MPSDWDLLLKERLRALSVPERDIVPIGIGGAVHWSPAHEQEPRRKADCPKCLGRIKPGSDRYCPKCKASGFDGKLFEQRILIPDPPPEKRPDPVRPARKAGRPKRNTKG